MLDPIDTECVVQENSAVAPALQEKWDGCFASALRKFNRFLDDPEQVAAFNLHAAELLHDMKEYAPAYAINAQATSCFRKYSVTHVIGECNSAKCYNIGDYYTDKKGDRHLATAQSYIVINPEVLEKRKSVEVTKTALHELAHAYFWGSRILRGGAADPDSHPDHDSGPGPDPDSDPDFNPETKTRLGKKEELLCDTIADLIVPWPRYGDMRLEYALQEYADDIETEEDIRAIQNFEGATHPSNAAFMANADKISYKMGDRRYDEYLERIYDGYVPHVG